MPPGRAPNFSAVRESVIDFIAVSGIVRLDPTGRASRLVRLLASLYKHTELKQ